MKHVVIWALALLGSSALATLLLYDNGHVAMVWGDWVIETSVSFALVVAIVGFAALYLAVRLLMNIWHFPTYWRNRQRLKRYDKAENAMARGMIALEYGDWQKAEKQLIKSAKHSEAGLVHYLSAAKMAHNQQAGQRRDQYLTQARAEYPEDYVTIGLVEARLLADSEPEVALTILETLYEQQPRQRAVLAEYAVRLKENRQWNRLERLLPEVKHYKAMTRDEALLMEEQVLAGKIASATSEETLDALWHPMSNRQKLRPVLLTEYVEQRLGWNQEVGLQALIEKSVRKQWHDRLIYQYGRLTLGPAFDRLKTAERWLQKEPDNAVLLLTLGRLACRSQMWGLGQSYLKRSIELNPQVETFHALAQCYESEGEEHQAALIYKQAILKLDQATHSDVSSLASSAD